MVINYLMILFEDIEHFHQELFLNQHRKHEDATAKKITLNNK
jgi:hypothetical protein